MTIEVLVQISIPFNEIPQIRTIFLRKKIIIFEMRMREIWLIWVLKLMQK